MASASDIQGFLNGPLVCWLRSCIPDIDNKLIAYENYFDGFPFRDVLLKIDPDPSEPVPALASFHDKDILSARIQIFHVILSNIQTIYLTELNQVVVKLPDIIVMATEPSSLLGLQQLELMLLLLLGIAVQGPTRDFFVNRIQQLGNDDQVAIAHAITQVTEGNNLTVSFDVDEARPMECYLIYLKTVIEDRNIMLSRWVEEFRRRIEGNSSGQGDCTATEASHYGVEIVDLKSQIRRLRQSADEKSDHIIELEAELRRLTDLNTKVQTDNNKLIIEKIKADRSQDEWDALTEKVKEVEELQNEIGTLRKNLIDAKCTKLRLDELFSDNKLLERTIEAMEVQMEEARKKAMRIFEVEGKLLSAQKTIDIQELDLNAAKAKIQELEERNAELQLLYKNKVLESEIVEGEDDEDVPNTTTRFQEFDFANSTSIGEELNNNARRKALELQIENQQLQAALDDIKHKDFYENRDKVRELEKDKKMLSMELEKVKPQLENLKKYAEDIEAVMKKAVQESVEIQREIKELKDLNEKQNELLQFEKSRNEELRDALKHCTAERDRNNLLLQSFKFKTERTDKWTSELRESIVDLKRELEMGKMVEKEKQDLIWKKGCLEKDIVNLHKEVENLKELLEMKSMDVDQRTDKITILERQVETLIKQKRELMEQVGKLQDCERKAQELLSQAAVHSETITTLQRDLVTEKVTNEKFRTNMEKLGLTLDVLDNDINVILETMLENLEVFNTLTDIYKTKEGDVLDVDKHLEEMASSLTEEWRQQVEKLEEEISALQGSNKTLQTENASLKVDISTFKSQLQSLQMQQTALQLANSQLVAEKEDLSRLNLVQQNQHRTLSQDQSLLRNIHAELTAEYEKLLEEKESLKKNNRDLKTEARTYNEKLESLESKIKTVEQERDLAKDDSKHLSFLRSEHSKLKADFRTLLSTSERFKVECKTSREELHTLRAEFREMRSTNTEMKSELLNKTDAITNLQLENAVLQQKCEMLQDNLNKLDATRINLLESYSELCRQSLTCMAESMDRQSLSQMEAKRHWEQYNNILRQKDKLEEKIFDFYKNLGNANQKKSGFASLVRRVRKAGSGIMNRSRSNRRSSEEETTPTKTIQAEPQVAGPSGSASAESNNSSNGNESDNSIEEYQSGLERSRTPRSSLHGQRPRDEIELRRSLRHSTKRSSVASEELLLRDSPSLGSIGSRRTVYISEDEPAPSPSPIQSTPLRDANPPLLVYNRISTVIGGDTLCTLGNQTNLPEIPRENSDGKKPVNPKETAVWYEYGCV